MYIFMYVHVSMGGRYVYVYMIIYIFEDQLLLLYILMYICVHADSVCFETHIYKCLSIYVYIHIHAGSVCCRAGLANNSFFLRVCICIYEYIFGYEYIY